MNYYMNSLNNSYLAVHTDALCANVAAIEKTLSPGAEIIPVLKCDAYGLSLSLTAPALAALPGIQLDILRGLAKCVKPGGTLLYSTCTLLRRENEEVAGRFLETDSTFKPESFTLPGPVGTAASGMVTLWPHRHGTDGFFICKLRKEG